MPTVPDRIAALSPEKRMLLKRRLAHKNMPTAKNILAPVRDDRERQLLSFAQQRLWFLDQLAPENPAYNICQAMRLQGRLDLEALHRALDAILARHESLRTSFASNDGRPVQVIAKPRALNVPLVNLSSLPAAERDAEVQRHSQAEAHLPFDLSRDLMLRARVLRLAADEHVLLFVMHHISSDGWSQGIFLRELAVFYQNFASGSAPQLAGLAIQYADFAHWQREWLQGGPLNRQLSYWQAKLENSPGRVALPTDRPRPDMQTLRGARCSTTLTTALRSKLQQLAFDENATLFVVLLAAFKALLFRHSGQTDISVGSGHANRNRVEVEDMIGYFVNTLVLRTDLSGSPTFRDLLVRVRDVCFGAHEHQDLPFEKLVAELDPERDLGHSPLFNVAFTLHNTPVPDFEMSGLHVALEKVSTATSKFDLSVFFDPTDDKLVCTAEYNTDLFDESTIAGMLEHYQVLLESAVEDPSQSIAQLPMLTEAERRCLVLDWNQTDVPYPAQPGLLGLFECHVHRTPSAPAVAHEGDRVTYAELKMRADHLAQRLRSLGVGSGVLVGLCAERSVDMVVGLLGILKSGAAYVPMDPEFPPERLQLMVNDARISQIVTQNVLGARLQPISADLVSIDASEPKDSTAPPETLADQGPRPDDLAYVIYTSGSSGCPKGVAIEHRNLVNYVRGISERLELEPSWHFAMVSTISADLGNTMLFASLCTGGCLHVLSKECVTNPRRFAEYCEEYAIDCLKTTPSHLAALMEDSAPVHVLPRARLILGGESLQGELVERIQALAPTCRLFNHYGPTEATIGVSTYEIVGPPPTTVSGTVPIGRPLPNSRLYILDDRMQPVPVGVAGQLCIGGAGVAREYFGRPRLTDEKFVCDPFREGQKTRLYQTGDLARFSRTGDIEFLGRRDRQVKVRGYRVELGEIEALIGQHSGVKAVTVMAQANRLGDNQLVAYVAPHGSTAALVGKRTTKLPNNLVVAHLNRSETKYLYREIFDLQAYLRHGITLTADDCVFDVGANIGLFSLFVNQLFGTRNIYAFEPNPVVFDVLQANMNEHCPETKRFRCGMSEQAGNAELTFFTGFSLLSGYHADVDREKGVVKTYIRNQGAVAAKDLLPQVDDLLADRFETQAVATQLRRFSDVIAEEAIERIDLLKINVEKSELDVLRGIDDGDWPKIRQIVMEVDVAENLSTITDMLERHGFDSVVQQDVLLEDTELCYVYAIRPSDGLRLIPEQPAREDLLPIPVVTESPPTPRDLHEYLSQRLPLHMVPSSYMFLETLPLTANGKLDRRALEDLAPRGQGADYTFVEPQTATERVLTAIWMGLLGAERIGLHDDFFALGGHSLTAMRMISRVLQRLDVDLSIRQVFTTPTLESLAKAIDQLKELPPTA